MNLVRGGSRTLMSAEREFSWPNYRMLLNIQAAVAELADAQDLKSCEG